MTSKNKQHRTIPYLTDDFTDEELARDWTLSELDRQEITQYRKAFRVFVAIQIITLRQYGRFLNEVYDLSPRIINYLNQQLDLPPALHIDVPRREATRAEQRNRVLRYLGFQRFDETARDQLVDWIDTQAKQGVLPTRLISLAEAYLFRNRILLPGTSVLERMISHVCSKAHNQLFVEINQIIAPELRSKMDDLLTVGHGQQRTYFAQLKEYPPAASISSLNVYLERFQTITQMGLDSCESEVLEPDFAEYLFNLSKRYGSTDMKRFNAPKRYTLMLCFLLETRKILLDHLVNLHDQYVTKMGRVCKNLYEKQHRQLRKRQKHAIDVVLDMSHMLLDWSPEYPVSKRELFQQIDEQTLRDALNDLKAFKQLEERGYGQLLIARYPSLRKYFAQFIWLPFRAEHGSDALLNAIHLVRRLDAGDLKALPSDVPTGFVPKELRSILRDSTGKIQRSAWETGLALAIKDALRSGDLYLPQSKRYVSFWDLILTEDRWQTLKVNSYDELEQCQQPEVKRVLSQQFHQTVQHAQEQFQQDPFATIKDGKLTLKRDRKQNTPTLTAKLQKAINASLPIIRIEQLLMEVDQLTQFTQHFTPIQDHPSRPEQFYKTLLAGIISQATNLGVVAMASSVDGITVDMLRYVLHHFVREETLNAANATLVDRHHQLPLSAVHGQGNISSSDGQRFKIRASSLLASYYPRYYGYYEKAIGIYTHVSDQYSVFNTKVISCSPREALYVLDGLLENNTILQPREHTTDTHGYTEIIFALCYLLGFYFMPRIRDLKDQQLYRIDRNSQPTVFRPLLTKTANLVLVEEQWEAIIRVALSLKQRTAPAHVIVQRLTNSFPSDRLSRAFTNLGRIIKTEYILRYLTDSTLRQKVQSQLAKGEYRHKLPRWIFFADQGAFRTGDYEEIMNKASCLSLVSNAILYWNTLKISEIVESLRQQGEVIDDEALSHVSLLPYRHVLPNGTYFINDR